MLCECGHTPAHDARFCGQCGRKVALTGPTAPIPRPASEPFGPPAVGDATMAGVGIVPAWKVWASFGAIAVVLLAAGVGLRFALVDDEVVAVGAGEEGAPVLIDVDPDEVPLDDADPNPDPDSDPDLDSETDPDPDPDLDSETDPDPDLDSDPDPDPPRMRPTPMRQPSRDLPPPSRPADPTPATPAPWSGTSTGTTGTTGTTTTGTTTELALRYRTDARRRIATQYGASIQRCFDAGDAQVPGFSGSVAMAFMLMQDGRVASTRIARDTTGIPAVSACLRQAAQSWQLPPPPPRTLELSMTFSR